MLCVIISQIAKKERASDSVGLHATNKTTAPVVNEKKQTLNGQNYDHRYPSLFVESKVGHISKTSPHNMWQKQFRYARRMASKG